MKDEDAISRKYSRLAGGYDRRWPGYIRATIRETIRALRARPGDRLLDVGCGTGALLASIAAETPGTRLVGLDLSPEMLQVARRRLPPSIPLVTGSVRSLPFASGSFDLVVSSSSFHYWSEPLRGLSEIHRVLSPGGRLVVTDWCHDYLSCRICDGLLRFFRRAGHRSYRSRECRGIIDRAFFAVESLEKYKIDWLWGLMTVSARRN